MDHARFLVGLGGPAPDHHQTVDVLVRTEPVDVLHQHLRHLPVTGALLDLFHTVEVLDPTVGEDGRIRLDRPQLVSDAFDVPRVEDARFHRRGVGIVRVGVPASELDVVEGRQGHEVLDQRVALSGASAQPDV